MDGQATASTYHQTCSHGGQTRGYSCSTAERSNMNIKTSYFMISFSLRSALITFGRLRYSPRHALGFFMWTLN